MLNTRFLKNLEKFCNSTYESKEDFLNLIKMHIACLSDCLFYVKDSHISKNEKKFVIALKEPLYSLFKIRAQEEFKQLFIEKIPLIRALLKNFTSKLTPTQRQHHLFRNLAAKMPTIAESDENEDQPVAQQSVPSIAIRMQ